MRAMKLSVFIGGNDERFAAHIAASDAGWIEIERELAGAAIARGFGPGGVALPVAGHRDMKAIAG